MENDDQEVLKRLIIADSSFLTLREKINLQNKLDSAAQLALMSINSISEMIGRVLRTASWNGELFLKKAHTSLNLLKSFGISWTAYDRKDYPAMLREMNDPPYMLFYRGMLGGLMNSCVSVVGTRRATAGGRTAAVHFAHDAADDNCTVVSGLAYGIDICAHRGALESSFGATAAVLPAGIDTIVPIAHIKTAAGIIEKGGCILSEYTPGTPAQPFRFVQRNRIIAALSPATLVVQAPAGSGALITASFALEYGRDVLFHAAAFSNESLLLEKAAEHDLEVQIARGRNVAYKLENSPVKYRSDGAPVIENYAGYCSCRAHAPGTSSGIAKDKQIHLF